MELEVKDNRNILTGQEMVTWVGNSFILEMSDCHPSKYYSLRGVEIILVIMSFSTLDVIL